MLGVPSRAAASYADGNPFVEAMLRMMEIMGLIDRGSLGYSVPYLPGYGGGLGGMPGLGSYYPGAMGMWPGTSLPGAWGGMPGGMGGMPGGIGGMPGSMGTMPGGWPGLGGMPGNPGWPGMGNWPGASLAGNAFNQVPRTPAADLDGIWELTNGSVAIIRGRQARLYADRDRHQDFSIAYDGQHFWWTPRGGNTTTHYRYRMRDGRMVLSDNDGKVLLMRRRN